MKSVMLDTPRSLIEQRRKLGLDRWDEVWEGVLHMVPPPHGAHGRLNDGLAIFFRLHWEDQGLGRTYLETGVKRPGVGHHPELGKDVPNDYRTPDRSFLLPERYERFQGGWIVGGPDVALEIVSPGDESREKLPFFHALGVREAILIDRDTREVEVFVAAPDAFVPVAPEAEGWVQSLVLDSAFRREVGEEGVVLHLRRVSEPERSLRIGV